MFLDECTYWGDEKLFQLYFAANNSLLLLFLFPSCYGFLQIFFSQWIRLLYYNGKLFYCIPVTFYSLLVFGQWVCYSYISDSLLWNHTKLTLGLCRPEWCAKIEKYIFVLHLWSGFWYYLQFSQFPKPWLIKCFNWWVTTIAKKDGAGKVQV